MSTPIVQKGCSCGSGSVCWTPPPSGLVVLPLQKAGFAEIRSRMLAEVNDHAPLSEWTTRTPGDLGVMLVEWWAYISDILHFYDGVFAHDSYLIPSRRQVSTGRLVELLGFRPRPAMAAQVVLGVIARGRRPVLLPAGQQVRSGAFDDQSPQIFEIDRAALIDPARNQWQLGGAAEDSLGQRSVSGILHGVNLIGVSQALNHYSAILAPVTWKPAANFALTTPPPDPGPTITLSSITLDPARSSLKGLEGGGAITLVGAGLLAARTVLSLNEYRTVDDTTWKELHLDADVDIPDSLTPSSIRLYRFSQTAGLWTLPGTTGVVGSDSVLLGGVEGRIVPGDRIMVSRAGQYPRPFTVKSVGEESHVLDTGGASDAVNVDDEEVSLEIQDTSVPATRVYLDALLNDGDRRHPSDADTWDDSDAAQLTIHFAPQDSGGLEIERLSGVTGDEPLALEGFPRRRPRRILPPLEGRFLLRDAEDRGADVHGTLDFSGRRFTFADGDRLDPPFTAPIQAYGNVASATRGESVHGEILGSGDPSVTSQEFTLKKAPLTYLPAPEGYSSTLSVRVDGLLWTEVNFFYGQPPEAEVYIVREDEDGNSRVIFGDGIRGSRLPAGTDNVAADYRFGAGEAAPPAGSIIQLNNPPSGVSEVLQPLAAYGGADRQSAEDIKQYAPDSALLLGRAVSLLDFHALAASVPGVRAVDVGWFWRKGRQRPGVQVWYIGDDGIAATVLSKLRAQSDPGHHFEVEAAANVSLHLSLQIEWNERFRQEDVLDAVRERLLLADDAMLRPENIGIGAPLFRSRIIEGAMSVDGVLGVPDIQHDGFVFTEMGLKPGTGSYFDLESGALLLNGTDGTEAE